MVRAPFVHAKKAQSLQLTEVTAHAVTTAVISTANQCIDLLALHTTTYQKNCYYSSQQLLSKAPNLLSVHTSH
jgi:hypothetical protein